MRKLLIAAVVAAVALVSAAVALAYTQNYTQTFNDGSKVVKKPGATAGTNISISSYTTAPGDFPPRAKEIDFTYPAGAVINQKAAPQCGATNQDFSAKGPTACPSKTKIGSGGGTVKLQSGGKPIPFTVAAFNGKSKTIILYIRPSLGQPLELRPKIKAGTTYKIITKVPVTCVTPGGPTGCVNEARINSFNLKLKKIGGKNGKPAFLTTPPKCPSSKKWTFKGIFKYGAGATPAQKPVKSNSPCKA